MRFPLFLFVCAATSPLFALVPDSEAEGLARAVLARMTLEEKAMMTGGSGTMTLAALPHLGLAREWTFADSSSTVRAKMSRWDWSYCGTNDEATVLVSLSGLASTWNAGLARRHGEVIGEEARDRGVDQMLGPGLNLMRTPLGGRNWEYLGEDPVLAARLCVPLIRGVQSRDVASTVKHFVLNDQELARDSVDTHCGARAFNEIYLLPFRAAIEEAGVLSVMTSYNRVDGEWASENPRLLRDVLRGRLGFKGLITTDWGGQHSTVRAANSGAGLEMHWGQGIRFNYQAISNRFPLAEAVRRGDVPGRVVDDMAFRTLYVMAKTGFLGGKARFAGSRNTRAHREFARQEAGEAIVLLKNDRKLLPLEPSRIRRLAVVGLRADERQCNKGCSAEGKPPYEVTPFAGLRARFSAAEVTLHPLPVSAAEAATEEVAADISDAVRAGAHAEMEKNGSVAVDEAALRRDLEAADAVIVFTGTELGWGAGRESEGGDRPTMKGRPGEDGAVRKVLGWVGEKAVVIVRCGSPVEYTWWDRAETVLNMSYLGQEAGHALGDVVSGDVNPSGRLPYTWPRRYADTAVAQCGDYNATNVTYREGLFTGYRWFEKKGIRPQFPFGFGLGYTTFRLEGLTASRTADGGIRAEIAVTNTGAREGREVVQFYVARPDSCVERPVKELKAFAKVSLAPGESRRASVTIRPRDLQHWDEAQSAFAVEPGRVEVLAGTSSSDIAERTFVPDAVAYFKPGERISFFGDSIVHGGWFEHLLGLFAALRDPGSNVRITNVGISGDTAGGGLERFDWDLLPTKPDRVFTFFGMNDVGRGDYRTKAPDGATRKRRAASLERYRANQAKLADRLAAAGIGQVCLTPSPYDEYSAIRTTNLAAVNSQGLSRCAEIVRDLAADRGLPLADIHPSLTDVFAADTASSLTGDRVHPGCAGHLMMMAEILAAMDVSPTVAETTVAATGDGASFDYAPKALPFPKSWYYEQAEKRYPLTERINREIIRVTGLPPGRYDLAFDGRTVGAFTADEFAAGVNVALLDTPNQRTAQTAWKLMCGIKDAESALRDIALVRCQLLAAKVDPDDWAAADAHLDARLQKLREQKAGNLGYYESVYGKYRKCRGEVAALTAKADGLRAEMNALRPAVSRVSIQWKEK